MKYIIISIGFIFIYLFKTIFALIVILWHFKLNPTLYSHQYYKYSLLDWYLNKRTIHNYNDYKNELKFFKF